MKYLLDEDEGAVRFEKFSKKNKTKFQSKPPKTVKCGLTGKRLFPSIEAAEIRMREIQSNDSTAPQSFRAYQCEFCNK